MPRVETVEYRPNPMRLGMAPGVMEARFAALMRWATPDSFAVFSASLVVSGYAAKSAFRLMRNGRELGTVTDASTAALQGFAWGIRPQMQRCHRLACRTWYVPTPPPMVRVDGQPWAELGWLGFCPPCTEKSRAACLRRHGALPVAGAQFYCPYCRRLRRHPEDRCSPEMDGRVRIRCIQCRRGNWRKTDARKRRREKARRAEEEARG